MDPKIIEYIRENRGRYAREAIRERLIAAGHDPGQVDAALASPETAHDTPGTPSKPGPHFWRWAFAIQAVTVLVVTALVARNDTHGYAAVVFVVLGIALLIGTAISGTIGKALLPRTGLIVAILLPLISAMLLGGWCLRIMGTV